jgi:hypothetical protein
VPPEGEPLAPPFGAALPAWLEALPAAPVAPPVGEFELLPPAELAAPDAPSPNGELPAELEQAPTTSRVNNESGLVRGVRMLEIRLMSIPPTARRSAQCNRVRHLAARDENPRALLSAMEN